MVLYHYTARDFQHLYSDENPFSTFALFSQFGYLGVDLFFIISGFVITLSVENRKPMEFAISRFSRLYPCYWVAITFTAVIVTLLPDQSGDITLGQYFANFLMFHPDLGFRNIDGVYWTLQVELQFYLLVFFLMVSGLINRYRWWLSIWLGFTVTYLLFSEPFFMGWIINPHWSSYFIAGVAFYLIMTRGISSYSLLVVMVSLIVSVILAFKNVAAFIPAAGVMEGVVAGVLVCGIYGVFFLFSTGVAALRPMPWVIFLGGLTYPLYLFHNRAGRVIFDAWALIVGPFFTLGLLIGGMLAVSAVAYLFVEKRLAGIVRRRLRTMLMPS